MTELTFDMTFHTPFQISTGDSAGGRDQTVDRTIPLPATSLKGVMRASARRLGLRPDEIARIFGGSAADGHGGAGWAWSDAVFGAPPSVVGAARIVINAAGVVDRGFLKLGEQNHASSASFVVEQIRALPDTVLVRQVIALRAAARATLSLGGERRRGSGWVTITDRGRAWTDADTDQLRAMLRAPA